MKTSADVAHCPPQTRRTATRTILRGRQGGDPPPLDGSSGRQNIHALQRFVRTLRQDLAAVEGTVRERWSNGSVEGQINRPKMFRGQMYGRGGVELLRLLPMPFLSLR
jgi:hypothetical protein